MSKAWMPLYIGDYKRKTERLTLAQHGAYLLLIMHYWDQGGLPDNDEEMARILRVSCKQLPSIWLALASFFDENRRHKRLDEELEKARVLKEKRAYSGRLGGLVSRNRNNGERFIEHHANGANAKQTGGTSQSPILTSLPSSPEPPQAVGDEATKKFAPSPYLQANIARKYAP